MKRLYILTWVLFFFAFTVNAQRLEVGLKSGKVLTPSVIVLDKIYYDDVYLIADCDRFSPDEVSYYQNEEGYYKWYLMPVIDAGFRVVRFSEGEISTYGRVDQRYYKDRTVADDVRDKHAGYFQKQNQEMQSISYLNLLPALEGNSAARAYLEKTEKMNRLAKIGFGVGAALIAGGIVHSIAAVSDNSSNFSPIFYPGLTIMATSIAIRIPYKKRLRKSIEIYNN
ncbi:hypothetical protein [Reichenbachiella versicolor]|uniref:hypothetical protein n=1 Tax=Reichenbachiella versicolor TaxID=1821036 RepID=UPI000D6E15E4|nr:hypothetical protein [Reichenbachiella versicolor]